MPVVSPITITVPIPSARSIRAPSCLGLLRQLDPVRRSQDQFFPESALCSLCHLKARLSFAAVIFRQDSKPSGLSRFHASNAAQILLPGIHL